MNHELRVFDDTDTLARAASDYVADRARRVIDHGDTFGFAVSGGKTPWLMFDNLTNELVEWNHTSIFQVDERVVPADSDLRNLKSLRESLLG
ncbi:MAG TPA: 6-phosphogluconolactonase, partial [Acidimicrobiales bacterium]|nr:6-phosphogluconolactonase [Acidimicrobiales bacterium]